MAAPRRARRDAGIRVDVRHTAARDSGSHPQGGRIKSLAPQALLLCWLIGCQAAELGEIGGVVPIDASGDLSADGAEAGDNAEVRGPEPDIAPVACPDDGDPCTRAERDPEAGCTQLPLTGSPCDDESACTTDDSCVIGRCTGTPVACDDANPCTADACDPAAGCVYTPDDALGCDDGSACTTGDACADGTCAGTPIICDDGNPCTASSCDPELGCVHPPLDGAPCDDGDPCTSNDHCEDAACGGETRVCDDGNPCTGDICDPITGACAFSPGSGALCDDGNACTDVDRCLEGSCAGSAAACDDGNPCTLDSCTVALGCIHTEPPGLPCDDGDACTRGDRCYKGACVPGDPRICDDAEPCTADSCDPATGCFFVPLSGPSCDDGDACTAGDTCAEGSCAGDPIICEDGNPCTAASCDRLKGCVYAELDIPCDDGDPCTDGDRCVGGQCQPGANPQCLAVERVVLGGDSWSAGLVGPLRDALNDRGYEEVALTWELTAKPGSTVAGWLDDPNMMTGLFVSLDADPPAEILFFTLGGNDFLGACKSGLGLAGPVEWWLVMSRIQADLQQFVALAQAGRPHLRVVLIGYDYLQYYVIQLLGVSFPGMDPLRFNLGLVDLATRGRDLGVATPNMVYAHNMGILQYAFGDSTFGYGPGAVPKPGPAPGYDPFPGGWFTHPSPLAHIPDGIHPDYDGFRVIIENTLDQGAAAWIEGKSWP